MSNTIDSVWKKVQRRGEDECWPWIGYKNWGNRGGGYGRMDVLGFSGSYAHRLAYISANPGSGLTIDQRDGKMVLHDCDNPECCNPKHLYVGDHAQNMADKVARGRQKRWTSTNSPRAKLTREQVIELRRARALGIGTKALMEKYGLSRAGVKQIVQRRYYKDIP